jgi:hypothetical protein
VSGNAFRLVSDLGPTSHVQASPLPRARLARYPLSGDSGAAMASNRVGVERARLGSYARSWVIGRWRRDDPQPPP